MRPEWKRQVGIQKHNILTRPIREAFIEISLMGLRTWYVPIADPDGT
jgi:hypothetical protein